MQYLIYFILSLLLLIIQGIHYIHIFQLSGYKIAEFCKSIKPKELININIYKKQNLKKPLVFTNRVKRLILINVISNFLVLYFICKGLFKLNLIFCIIFVLLSFTVVAPIYTIISALIALPIEKFKHYLYKLKAMKKLNMFENIRKIAITGSYGKTSCKFILKTILEEKYNVLATPSSFNTPMGISKTINEELNEKNEIFICEMGARKPKQIRELAKMVKPNIGMITSIGNQHLETFKNIENIMKTKYELIEELPKDGIAVFNTDNDECFKLYKKTENLEKLSYSLEEEQTGQLLHIKDIKVNQNGSNFKLLDTENNMVFCTTKLLGKHNILNILGCATIAKKMGLTLEEIAKGISKIEPVEHRLAIIANNGITIIDDAFNSNPKGAKQALDVLEEFKDAREKIVVTPGMVELGTLQYSSNLEFGKQMAQVATKPIIVGKTNRKALVQGLKEGGMKESDIIVVDTLEEASSKVGLISSNGDVILFENDLPDNYD